MLTALVLTLYHDISRKVGYPHGGLRFIYMLSARSACTEVVYFEVGRVYLELDLVSLDEHRDGNCRGVDTSLRLGLGDALYAVDTALILQA